MIDFNIYIYIYISLSLINVEIIKLIEICSVFWDRFILMDYIVF